MVIHILKDGTRVDDIAGRVVKVSDAEVVYKLMDEINRKIERGWKRDKNT
jgi:hypothetical protein